MKKILPFFSYLFHPIFTGVFAALFYFSTCQKHFDYPTIYLYVIQILIMTVFLPLGIFYFLISIGKVDSIMITNTAQRKIPLFIQIVLIGFLIYKSITLQNLPELHLFFLGSILSSILALLFVYLKIKASLHMLGVAALTFFYIGLNQYFDSQNYYGIALLLVCNGLVAISRLYMKAHTYSELFLGYLIGLLPQLLLFIYKM